MILKSMILINPVAVNNDAGCRIQDAGYTMHVVHIVIIVGANLVFALMIQLPMTTCVIGLIYDRQINKAGPRS